MTKSFLNDNERIDQLYSQDVKIIQSSEVFSFSLDAVLLADFVPKNPQKKLKIVDLCAGNGAVGLFLNSKIAGNFTEIEIQPRLADMAERSILLNHLESRYDVLNIDLADTFDYLTKDSTDIVVCNPPYFTNLDESKKNPNDYLAIARHEIKTNLDSVLQVMSGLLKMNGKGYMVHRPDRLVEILGSMEKYRLAPKKIRFIHPKKGKEANMALIEVIKDGKPGGVRILPELVVNAPDSDEYSTEVKGMLYGG